MTAAAGAQSVVAAGVAVDGRSRIDAEAEERCKPASPLKLAILCVVAILSVTALTALGVWQVQRLGWKLDLIARVNQRVAAAPVPAPGPASWSRINAADDAYRHVSVRGRFGNGCDTLVRAVTELGGGYWVLAPFQVADGFTVLVNRGFVPSESAKREACAIARPPGATMLTGLLRISEPGGGFLRHNDSAGDRWYSRDVAAIAAARGIEGAAPYFIDAEASADRAALPVEGLTVIAFPNNHLVYALTWFGLAIMAAGWSLYAARQEWVVRKRWTWTGDRNS
jgi:surfeit locus 1 family protein